MISVPSVARFRQIKPRPRINILGKGASAFKNSFHVNFIMDECIFLPVNSDISLIACAMNVFPFYNDHKEGIRLFIPRLFAACGDKRESQQLYQQMILNGSTATQDSLESHFRLTEESPVRIL